MGVRIPQGAPLPLRNSSSNLSAMRDAFRNIVDELGAQYTVAYQPTSKKDGRWHSLELRVSKPNLTIRTRKGYVAETAK